MFLRLFAGLFFALFCLTGCEDKKQQEKNQDTTWVVGISADNPPFSFIDTTKGEDPQGFEIELMKVLAQKIGCQVTFRDMEFGQLIPTLQGGHITMVIAGVEVNEERSQVSLFSQPYYYATRMVLSLAKNPLTFPITWSETKLGVQMGSTHGEFALELQKQHPALQVITYNTILNMIMDLKSERIHGVLIDGPTGLMIAKEHQLHADLLPEKGSGYAIVFTKGQEDLVKKVNEALSQLKESGELQALEKKWFHVAD